jgi:hypothetical protein
MSPQRTSRSLAQPAGLTRRGRGWSGRVGFGHTQGGLQRLARYLLLPDGGVGWAAQLRLQARGAQGDQRAAQLRLAAARGENCCHNKYERPRRGKIHVPDVGQPAPTRVGLLHVRASLLLAWKQFMRVCHASTVVL